MIAAPVPFWLSFVMLMPFDCRPFAPGMVSTVAMPFATTIQYASMLSVITLTACSAAAVKFDSGEATISLPNQVLVSSTAWRRFVYFQSSSLTVGKPVVAKCTNAALRAGVNASSGIRLTAASSSSWAIAIMRLPPPAPSRSLCLRVVAQASCRPIERSGPRTAHARSRVRHSRGDADSG